MSRNIVPAKKNIIDDKLDIVLLSAGRGRRMKSFGSRSLFPIASTTLINYQIQTIKRAMPKAEIVAVLGYEIDKICKHIPSYVRVVENNSYESTTSTRSAFIGVRACSNNHVLIINGDLFFNEKLLDICVMESSILVDTKKLINENKIGVVISDGYLSCFNFDINIKWGQAVYLTNNDIEVFQKICLDTKQEVILSEIIDTMVDRNCKFKATEPKGLNIIEIDSYKDLERIK